MALQFPEVNGNRFSFASIELNLGGKLYKGFSEISYQQALNAGAVRGTSPQVLGYTRGDLEAEGSLGLYLEEDQNLIQAMGEGFYEQVFPITVTFQDTGTPTVVDSIPFVRFKSGNRSFQKGTDGLTVKRDLIIWYIKEYGVNPIYNLAQ